MTRLVPKIMKRKWSSDEDSDGAAEYDEDSFQKRPHDELSRLHEEQEYS